MRLTPLLAAAISSITQMITRISGNRSHSMSRRKEMAGEAGVIPRSSGNCSERDGEHNGDDRLAGDLGLAPQSKRALLADLDVVVQKADHA